MQRNDLNEEVRPLDFNVEKHGTVGRRKTGGCACVVCIYAILYQGLKHLRTLVPEGFLEPIPRGYQGTRDNVCKSVCVHVVVRKWVRQRRKRELPTSLSALQQSWASPVWCRILGCGRKAGCSHTPNLTVPAPNAGNVFSPKT